MGIVYKIMKEIGLEVTYPKKHTKTFKEIEVPKGFRLPELWELFRIACVDLKFLKENLFVFYFSMPTQYAKENNLISRLVVYSNGVLYSYLFEDVVYSYDRGRVIFVRDLK